MFSVNPVLSPLSGASSLPVAAGLGVYIYRYKCINKHK